MRAERDGTFIINACLTGMVARKEHNPAVPMTPEEIAADAEACIEAGASMLHVHARDEDEEPDWRPEAYERIIRAIREVSEDVVICVSTSGRRVSDFERRSACLDTDPPADMASLTLGSINFLHEGVVNSPQMIRRLAERMAERGIRPELEVFDIGMARTANRLVRDGTVPEPCYANILLGNAGTADLTPMDLAAVVSHLPERTTWCVAGIARKQLPANLAGLVFGHGVRIGLEDNLYLDEAKSPATNPALVQRIAELGRLQGLRPATSGEVRESLGLR